jgi:thiamine biosynthesis lipoprotein
MKRRTFIFSLIGTTAAAWSGWKLSSSKWKEIVTAADKLSKDSAVLGKITKFSRKGHALGTNVTITIFHQDPQLAEKAMTDAFEAIEQVEQLMSIYRPDSQLSQLNRDGYLNSPHPDLLRILQTSNRLSKGSGGAFDVTIQPLWKLYYDASQKNTSPNRREIEVALQKVDWHQLEISSQAITLHHPGAAVTLNGIAQGFAADAVGKVLQSYGVHNALIDTGEIGTLGTHVRKNEWTIGIKHPRNPEEFLGLAALKGRCLATSGDYETRFGDDYQSHHLLDPRTGRSPDELSSVSVVAPTAMQADALSTAVFLMGRQKGKALIESMPNTDAWLVTKSGKQITTPNFPLSS